MTWDYFAELGNETSLSRIAKNDVISLRSLQRLPSFRSFQAHARKNTYKI